MKKNFLSYIIIIFFFCIYLNLYAETHISGIIDKKETWNVKNSPYIISNKVIIDKNGIVIVSPGTVIKFKKEGQIIVKGAFYVKGTQDNPIRFLPEDGESFYEGIKYETKYKSIFQYAIFIRGAIIVEGSTIEILNNYILNSTGIILSHFAKAIIKDNYFYNNTYGVYIDGKKTEYSIIQNTFNKNRFAIYIKESDTELITKNNFFNNTVNITNFDIKNIECKENYWGVVDERYISSFIFDKKNNPKVGHVNFTPFFKEKLNLFEPPPAFISLVKIYLSLKRPDEEPQKFGISVGGNYFFPFTPENMKQEANYGNGMEAEFVLKIKSGFALGFEGKILKLENKDKTKYDYKTETSSLYLNFYGYIGDKPNMFFIPYLKVGNGITILAEQYKFPEKTKKINEINYSVTGIIGSEIYILRFLSLKIEPTFNYIVSPRGNISSFLISLKSSIYFNSPFILNN